MRTLLVCSIVQVSDAHLQIPITIEDADVYLEIADRLREVGITPGQPKP